MGVVVVVVVEEGAVVPTDWVLVGSVRMLHRDDPHPLAIFHPHQEPPSRENPLPFGAVATGVANQRPFYGRVVTT